MDNRVKIKNLIKKRSDTSKLLVNDLSLIANCDNAANKIISGFKRGGKVLFCGNGGSAADAQHLAAELAGKFYIKRAPLFAEALHVNTSYLTAVANDMSFDDVYSRLVEAKGRKGDILVALSTSGKSKNIINALKMAKEKGMDTISLTGISDGEMRPYSDILINSPSDDTPQIQETHIILGHIICQLVEETLFVDGE